MARLTTLKPRIATLDTRRVKPLVVADRRITGRRLQDRRFNAWKSSPHCACCGASVQYPDGFELDHIEPMHKGGPDTPENCQILCSGPDGCHIIKTGKDMGHDVDKAARFPDWLTPAIGPLTIVFGAPGSGKTTYVEANAGRHDIVIDVDVIIAKLSGEPMYHGTSQWMEAALRVRNKMLAGLSRDDRPSYFITTGSTKAHREWWAARLRPRDTIIMGASEQECIDRVNKDERRPQESKTKAIEGIIHWGWDNAK